MNSNSYTEDPHGRCEQCDAWLDHLGACDECAEPDDSCASEGLIDNFIIEEDDYLQDF